MQRIPDDSTIFTAEAKAVDLALDFISTCDANNKFIIFSDSLSVSKEDSKVGCAVLSDNHSYMQRIPDDSTIFTAEAKAVDLALDFISTCDANNKFIIFSDSLSVSKEDSKVGCAVLSDNHSYMQRIPDDSTIFTAEAKAVDLALDFISTCDANNKFIIFSDSLSVSKEDSKVGCAVLSDNHSYMQRIPDDSTIFTAEAKAVDLALDFISTCDANNKFIIFSDSLSVSKEDSKVDCAVLSDNHSYMQRIPDDSTIFTAEAKAVDLALDFISTCDANNKFIIFSDSLSVSKEDSKVGCAVLSDNHSYMQRIPDDSTIFTAEAKAVDLALDFISTCDANNKFIIFSDSLSVLKSNEPYQFKESTDSETFRKNVMSF